MGNPPQYSEETIDPMPALEGEIDIGARFSTVEAPHTWIRCLHGNSSDDTTPALFFSHVDSDYW